MAEIRSTPPEQNTQTNQGSIFKTAIIASPIAIGGGIGISRLLKKSSHFDQPVEVIPNSASFDSIRRFTNRYVSQAHSGIFKDWQLDKLSGFSQNTALSREHVYSALMRSANSADPSGMIAKTFQKRLSSAGSASEIYSDILNTVQQNNSIYMRRTMSSFLQDVALLEERAGAGLPFEIQPFEPFVERKIKQLHYTDLDKMLGDDIAQMQKMLGAKVTVKEMSRTGVEGAQLALEFRRAQDAVEPWFTLNVPRVLPDNPNIITRGTTQQSRYIAGTYGLIEGTNLVKRFNHEQWMTNRAVAELVPEIMKNNKLSDRAIQQMARQFEQKMIESPEWIPSMPVGVHQGIDEYTRLRSQIMRLYTPGETTGSIRQLNEYEMGRIIERGGVNTPGGILPLYPGASPSQISKSIVSTWDPTGQFLVPETASFGRRPMQKYRLSMSPTAEAIAAMEQDVTNQRFQWLTDKVGIRAPVVRSAFVSSALGPQLSGTGVTSEGQFLLSDKLAPQFQMNKWTQFDIATGSAVELPSLLKGAPGSDVWDINKRVEAGTFLGYDPTGKPVTLEEDMFLSRATAFSQDRNKGDFIRVMAMQDISKPRYAKYFGIKGMGVSVSPGYLEDVLTDATQQQSDMFRNIDAIVTMDELKKNRALHYNQMFSSLWEFTQINMQSNKQPGTLASNFGNNPQQVIAEIRKNAMTQPGIFSHEAALSNIVNIAREAQLTPEQMGGVFGAVPEVFGGLSPLGNLSAAEATAIGRGVAVGATQLFMEETTGPTAGRMATLEPRGYELMGVQHFGELGPRLQQDIAGRMMAAYPERLFEQQELNEAILSLSKPGRRQGSVSVADMLGKMEDRLLPNEASNVRLPGKLGDLYIPSAASMSQLAAYQTSGGQAVTPDLATAYQRVLRSAQAYESRDITIDILNKEVENLRQELNRARIATVTGKGGLLRNRVPGSAFLRAVQPTAGQELGEGVVGITKPYAEMMFDQMKSLGIYPQARLSKMRKELLAEGGQIPGLLMRHPNIGPYSAQAVKYQIIPGNEPVAMINEKMQRAIAMRGKLEGRDLQSFEIGAMNAFRGNQDALRRAEQVGAEIMGSPIRLSPLVGLGADVDGDDLAAMFAGPQLQKSLTSHIANRDALAAYEEYAIRSQVLKAKAKGDNITIRKMMKGDVIKLGVTEGGTLGKLSTSLQQYRAGVLAGGLGAQEEAKALGLLEWLEQTPISSKHIAPGQEEKTMLLLQDIQEALQKKDASGIASAVRTVMTQAKASGHAAVNEGLTIAMEDIGTGKVTTRYIPGLDIDKTAETIANARRNLDTMKSGEVSAARLRQMIFNRTTPTTQESLAMMDPDVLKQSPFGGFFLDQAKSHWADLSTRVSAMSNRLGQAGKSMIGHARPLAIGTGVALGLATLLSEPPRILSPDSRTAPAANMRSGSGGAKLDTNIHPAGRVSGAPTVSSPVGYGNTARISPKSTLTRGGYNIRVRGNTEGDVDYEALNAQIRSAIGQDAQINSIVKDMRSSLTPQKLAEMLNR